MLINNYSVCITVSSLSFPGRTVTPNKQGTDTKYGRTQIFGDFPSTLTNMLR